MRKSLHDQIAHRCIHFNGVMNDACKAGVQYDQVRGDDKPFIFPCINPDINTCAKRQLPTEQEVQDHIKEIDEHGGWAITMLIKVKAVTPKVPKGEVDCSCGAKAIYTIAESNGHVWLSCPGCKKTFME